MISERPKEKSGVSRFWRKYFKLICNIPHIITFSTILVYEKNLHIHSRSVGHKSFIKFFEGLAYWSKSIWSYCSRMSLPHYREEQVPRMLGRWGGQWCHPLSSLHSASSLSPTHMNFSLLGFTKPQILLLLVPVPSWVSVPPTSWLLRRGIPSN